MAYDIWCYKHTDETIPFVEWSNDLQKPLKAKLEAKLDLLHLYGETLRPDTLANSDKPGISKLRVHGNVQLRPLLCRTTEHNGYVFLVGAKEIQSKLSPKNILETAVNYKQNLTADYEARKVRHEKYL